MNFIDASKSKKAFKRAKDRYWTVKLINHIGGSGIASIGGVSDDGSIYYLTHEDIFAEDWEIKERTVEVSKSQLFTAYADALKECPGEHIGNVASAMALNLGLTE